MSLKPSKKRTKQPNYLSHDFVIANHGDICSIGAMVFVIGLLFKGTSPLAAKFILMQYNTTTGPVNDKMYYHNGFNDILAILFYTLIVIVVHAIIQEYVLDKFSKRLSMTKARLSRFNHASQIAIFLAISVYYIFHILVNELPFRTISDLWDGYPHTPLALWHKFFFILQISYWLHNVPELYFQKVKKEELVARITPSLLYFVGIAAAYAMNFNRLCLAILLVQYLSDFVYYLSRACDLALVDKVSRIGFTIWNAIFVPVRVFIICLTFLTLQYGMTRSTKATANVTAGDFNTRIIRLNCLGFVFLTQAWMMWLFINYHLKKRRENYKSKSSSSKKSKKSN